MIYKKTFMDTMPKSCAECSQERCSLPYDKYNLFRPECKTTRHKCCMLIDEQDIISSLKK